MHTILVSLSPSPTLRSITHVRAAKNEITPGQGLRCHQRGGECSDPAPRGEKHTRPLPFCHHREIKLLGSILSFKRAWKRKAGALPRVLHPHSPGGIKGFPHNVQRKSEILTPGRASPRPHSHHSPVTFWALDCWSRSVSQSYPLTCASHQFIPTAGATGQFVLCRKGGPISRNFILILLAVCKS